MIFLEKNFLEYLFKMAKKYNARDMKRFDGTNPP
jgi:hypothetical protein